MRFLNWDATLEKAKEIGRAEGRAADLAEIRADVIAGIRTEARAEGRAEVIAEIRAAARAEGRAAARVERDLEWTEYTARLKAALERGEPFNEPPPSHYPRPRD